MNINHYLDNIDIIYWINLDRSQDRRKNMLDILTKINIPNKRIHAVDGKTIGDDKLFSNFINTQSFDRSKIEYAVLLSHLKTIKEFSQSEHNIALIFEDDLSIEYVKYWDKNISEIILNAPKDWDIIMLNYISKYEMEKTYTLNKNGTISSCSSYLINKKAAKKLMNKIYKFNKFILLPNIKQTADDYIYSILITYVYKYPYFTYPTDNDSTIHPSEILYHNYGKKLAFIPWSKKNNIPIKYNFYDRCFKIIFFYKQIIVIIVILIIIYILIKKNNYIN